MYSQFFIPSHEPYFDYECNEGILLNPQFKLNRSNEGYNLSVISDYNVSEEGEINKYKEVFEIKPNEKEQNKNKMFEIGKTESSTKCKLYHKKTNNEIFIKNIKKGRKKKEVKEKGDHTKYSDDNIMRKIKARFLAYIIKLLNKTLKNKLYRFYKLDSKISQWLKRDYNIELFNTKIKDLILGSTISPKYRNEFKKNKNQNQKLIEKIINEGEEKEVIKILDLTYLELFNVFRRKIVEISYELEMKIEGISQLKNSEFNDINIVFKELYRQELEKGELEKDINYYINKFEYLCKNYENWFNIKKGRNRNKNLNVIIKQK
jgi:hypothetical protein